MLDFGMLCHTELIPKFHNVQNDCSNYTLNNVNTKIPVLLKLAELYVQIFPQKSLPNSALSNSKLLKDIHCVTKHINIRRIAYM